MPSVVPEDSDTGQLISGKNRLRQYDFLADSFAVWQQPESGFEVGHRFICELNFYATQYLSELPGQYRSLIRKNVTVGHYIPPPWEEVNAHMDRFVVRINQMARDAGPIELAAYVLWRLNWIHPFMQGNGRTARALSYFLLCQKYNHWFRGKTIPERIRTTRDEYCALLRAADGTHDGKEDADLGALAAYINRLFEEQLTEG